MMQQRTEFAVPFCDNLTATFQRLGYLVDPEKQKFNHHLLGLGDPWCLQGNQPPWLSITPGTTNYPSQPKLD
jgi:hypothetical protein